MGNVVFFLLGVLAGIVLADRFARSQRGGHILTIVNEGAGEFAQTVADSFRASSADMGAARASRADRAA